MDTFKEALKSCVFNHTFGELPECAICLQPSLHPVKLPCSHIFCFLCVKGVFGRSRSCPLCRQRIPDDCVIRPNLLTSTDDRSGDCEPVHSWYYEGINGWWQYDERTGCDLEEHWLEGEARCQLLIAGFLYIIDFDKMCQFRFSDPNRRRRIKRDGADIVSKKGIAGLKIGNRPRNGMGWHERPCADGAEAFIPGMIKKLVSTLANTAVLSAQGDSLFQLCITTRNPASCPHIPHHARDDTPPVSVDNSLTLGFDNLQLGDQPTVSNSGAVNDESDNSPLTSNF